MLADDKTLLMNQVFKIFIVATDVRYSNILEHQLSLNPDYRIKKMLSAQACLSGLAEEPAVVVIDYALPDKKAVSLLQAIKKQDLTTQVIIISEQEDVQLAVDLLRMGAYDYIIKNSSAKERLWNSVINIRKAPMPKQETNIIYDLSKSLIGESDAIKRIYSLIEKAAKSNITVSISGETGTGKELVAKAIHNFSNRRSKPYVVVNVAAIPKQLLESELFGHEKGTFTGALARRIGKFEEAHQGTLFLDEIAELDFDLQAKLLRVLQEREVTRLGGSGTIAIDVRIVVATHKNLMEEVKKGNFREDLYYRLLGLPIALAPLRERGRDIILLAKHFINDFCADNQYQKKTMSPDAQQLLLSYPFPGNIRELRAIIELAVVMSENDTIQRGDITLNATDSIENLLIQELTLKDYTKRIIQHFLNKNKGNILATAKKLDIGKSTIYKMVQDQELQINY
ncbi:MAG: sigma-54-dependent Fis family transcriptional regulator [Adhaeribacter sp.]|nr:sigma-54-dependent Fis family transcriptional regulator [Adhaeribacter sp.]